MSLRHSLRLDWCGYDAARYAVTHWHYSKSIPTPPIESIGVWENDIFVGCVIFGRGASKNLLKPFGLSYTEGCELVRVALNKHNAEVTRIIRLSIALLRKLNPALRIIVSFADPNHGHIGTIYQAGNWIYTGKTPTSIEYIDPDGRVWHPRMIKKKGWTTVYGSVRRTLRPSQCRAVPCQGKYRYIYPLDREIRASVIKHALPYPERVRSIETEGCPPSAGGEAPTRTLQPLDDK